MECHRIDLIEVSLDLTIKCMLNDLTSPNVSYHLVSELNQYISLSFTP